MAERDSLILALQGGVGNQLFQWAYGTELRADGLRVLIDHVHCRGERPLAIGPLLSGWPRVPKVVGLGLVAAERLGALGFGPLPRLISETGLAYDPDVDTFARHGGGYLLGYFQSPIYFRTALPQVRREALAFLTDQLTASGQRLAEELSVDKRAVAIHVRRGDYVTNPAIRAHHGVLGSDYYRDALALLSKSGPARRVWFSDDPEWVCAHLATEPDLVCPPGVAITPAGEIALMAACSSRVIANSSFSWWAGFLGRQPSDGGMIVAPRQWLHGTPAPRGLLPDGWIQR
jgi:Glycosyl transferase family 11